MTNENFQKYFIIYFIIFGIIISFASTSINYFFQTQSMQKNMDKKAQEIFHIKIETILKPELKNMDNIVKYLAKNETLRKFLLSKKKNTEETDKFDKIFLALVGVEREIMQARILDERGKEIIRAHKETKDSDPYIVDTASLQDKSKRDYFKKLSSMKTESVLHSKIDLNIEHGKVERPYKPTLRIAVPILHEGMFKGAVIMNMLIDDLFIQIGNSSAFEHFILDKDKNYIYHTDDRFSFNKYKGIKRELQKDFPETLNAQGVYSYSIDDILNNDDDALFVLKTKKNYYGSLLDELLDTTLIVLAINLILSLVMSFLVARKPRELQISLLNAHKKLKSFTSIIDKYVITATTKPDSTILDLSSAFEHSSGYKKSELIGKPMSAIKDKDRDKSIIKDLWDTILSKRTWVGEIKNRKKDGSPYWLEQHVIPMLNSKKNIESFISVGIDITAKKELEKLATIDKLTGIYNRRSVDDFLNIEIEVAKRHSESLSVILIDIDHFKSVNDTYGHQAGDFVLSETVKTISKNLRKSDIFGRYGGEEFIVILPQTNANEAFVLAEKLRSTVEDHKFEVVGHKTICLGISEFKESDDEKSLVQKADKALYEAKESGRNRSVIYS